MPIYGLTNNVEPRLPLIARLFKGEPKREMSNGKKTAGKELDYFRVEFAPEYAYLAPLFTAKYGEQLKELHNVYLVGSTLDDCFSTWNEEYNAQRLLVRCDGGRKVKEWNEQLQRYESETDLCDALPRRDENGVMQHPECGCKRVGRLSFMLPEFMAQTGVIGYFLLTTHSFNDIQALYSVIKFAEGSLQATQIGELDRSLSVIPFVLGRVTREISAPTRDKQTNQIKQIKVKKSLVYMRIESSYLKGLVQAKLDAAQFGPIVTSQQAAALPHALEREIESGGFAVPSTRVEVEFEDDLDESGFDDPPQSHTVHHNPPATPVADPVKPKEDLGRNAALRGRFMTELKELGYTPKQALDTVGITSFEGWSREGFLKALNAAEYNDQGRDGKPVNEQSADETDDLAF